MASVDARSEITSTASVDSSETVEASAALLATTELCTEINAAATAAKIGGLDDSGLLVLAALAAVRLGKRTTCVETCCQQFNVPHPVAMATWLLHVTCLCEKYFGSGDKRDGIHPVSKRLLHFQNNNVSAKSVCRYISTMKTMRSRNCTLMDCLFSNITLSESGNPLTTPGC